MRALVEHHLLRDTSLTALPPEAEQSEEEEDKSESDRTHGNSSFGTNTKAALGGFMRTYAGVWF